MSVDRSYYGALLGLKMGLLDARKHLERVLKEEGALDPQLGAHLWHNLTGLQFVIRQESERVAALMSPETEDGFE